MENAKRDIFAFTGGQVPTAVNMDHVMMVSVTEKKVTFQLVSGAGLSVDLEDETKAKEFYNQIVLVWAGEKPKMEMPQCDQSTQS
jgi:hypothetical protein